MTDDKGSPLDHPHDQAPAEPDESHHGGHRLMMLACCVPMVIIVAILVITGTAGAGAIIFAVVCVGLMAAMMFTMPGDHRH